MLGSSWSCEVIEGVPTLLCLAEILTRIIDALLLFCGTGATIIFLWGCLKFVISGGDPKAIGSAKNTIIYALLGLVIILMAFAITKFFGDVLGVNSLSTLQFSLGD